MSIPKEFTWQGWNVTVGPEGNHRAVKGRLDRGDEDALTVKTTYGKDMPDSIAVLTALDAMSAENVRVGLASEAHHEYWWALHRQHRQNLKEGRGIELTSDELVLKKRYADAIEANVADAGEDLPFSID